MKTNQKNISIINKHCRLEGTLDFTGYLIVAGSIHGTLNAETVITEEASHVSATVHVSSLTVAGSFDGDITTTGTLTLLKTAHVNASIKYGRLIIEDGCTLNGKIMSNTDGS